MARPVFTEDFLRRLELLEVRFRRMQAGLGPGPRAGRRPGGRIEFLDYRKYAPGDEPRYIDWNVFGRHRRLFVKRFAREEQMLVCLLLDRSASMQIGRPEKLNFAKQVVLALAYLALASKNTVRLATFNDHVVEWSGTLQGKGHFFQAMDFLQGVTPSGQTAIEAAVRDFFEEVRRPCMLILASDLLDPKDSRRAFQLLCARGFDPSVIHLYAPEEIHPDPIGRTRLRDIETGRRMDFWLDPAELDAYHRELNAYGEQWREFCLRHQIRYVPVVTDHPFEDFVLHYLRQGGLVR